MFCRKSSGLTKGLWGAVTASQLRSVSILESVTSDSQLGDERSGLAFEWISAASELVELTFSDS